MHPWKFWDQIPENILPNISFPKHPDTTWHGIFMTRHDMPTYGMARHDKIWYGTWSHDMAWHGTGPPWEKEMHFMFPNASTSITLSQGAVQDMRETFILPPDPVVYLVRSSINFIDSTTPSLQFRVINVRTQNFQEFCKKSVLLLFYKVNLCKKWKFCKIRISLISVHLLPQPIRVINVF